MTRVAVSRASESGTGSWNRRPGTRTSPLFGVAAGLLYVVADVLAGLLLDGYSFRNQHISVGDRAEGWVPGICVGVADSHVRVRCLGGNVRRRHRSWNSDSMGGGHRANERLYLVGLADRLRYFANEERATHAG